MADNSISTISIQVRADATKLKGDLDAARGQMSSGLAGGMNPAGNGVGRFAPNVKSMRDRAVGNITQGFSSSAQQLAELRTGMRPDLLRKEAKLSIDLQRAQQLKEAALNKQIKAMGGTVPGVEGIGGMMTTAAIGVGVFLAATKGAVELVRMYNPATAARFDDALADLAAGLGRDLLPAIEAATQGLRFMADGMFAINKTNDKLGTHGSTGFGAKIGERTAQTGAGGLSAGSVLGEWVGTLFGNVQQDASKGQAASNWSSVGTEDLGKRATIAALNAGGGPSVEEEQRDLLKEIAASVARGARARADLETNGPGHSS